MFLFFNQKSSYEMRISDWSSDVCSSDLLDLAALHDLEQVFGADNIGSGGLRLFSLVAARVHADAHRLAGALVQGHDAANHLTGVTRHDARLLATSTVSSTFDVSFSYPRRIAYST